MKATQLFHKLNFSLPLLFCVVALALSACAKSHRAVDPRAAVIPHNLYDESEEKMAEGSIWPGEASTNTFFEDFKANKVGDIVTVLISETATSSQSATTDTGKTSSLALSSTAFLGLPSNFGVQNFLGMGNQFDPRVTASTARANKGNGTTTRTGTLTGTVTAIITEILPGGNFRIKGERSVTVNNEEQYMILTGIIRPVDINFNNTISSTLIADASIVYSGNGVVADEQRVGWMTRFLAYVWPF